MRFGGVELRRIMRARSVMSLYMRWQSQFENVLNRKDGIARDVVSVARCKTFRWKRISAHETGRKNLILERKRSSKRELKKQSLFFSVRKRWKTARRKKESED